MHRNEQAENQEWYGRVAKLYDALLAIQGGVCAICGSDGSQDRGRFHLDHDSSCCPGPRSCGRCVRGFLCDLCFSGLNAFEDDSDRLTAAAAYLIAHRELQQ
ncbi:hypothetical protein GCM10009850_047860 [Nonomuraea monospora]|uniref:Recombination endonuclease VII n=1 Tax=Nonomuraea monospora TaxID=568818 RepID=A0ABP5PFL1_9ACTN